MAEQKKSNPLYHNSFLLVFSFLAAIVIWFLMAAQNTDSNTIIHDVPIAVQISESASSDGVQVFRQSYTEADLELSGSNLITNKLSAEDFEVTALLNPVSTKLTGNTLQKAVIQVRAVKRSGVSDYNIVSVSPEEITVEYDRYKESSFPIEQDLKYSADSGYYPVTPAVSAQEVTVSGPESSVNKVSRAVASYTVSSPLRADAAFTCQVKLYDENEKELSDLAGLCLSLDVETVDVEIPVLSRKTVNLVALTLHQPKGFPDSRITVEPATLDIAGAADTLSSISEITLDTPIDFNNLDTAQKNVFTMDIPLPSGVRDISTGDATVSRATVSVNLNDFKKVTLAVPVSNFLISNRPADREVSFNTQQLDVTVVGSEAQINKLTGDSLSVQMDLANFSDILGTVEVPVTVAFTGSGSDSCWTLGQYTVSAQIAEESVSPVLAGSINGSNEASPGGSSDGVVASPNE